MGAINVVVFHGREEGNFYTQPPEEESSRKLQLRGQVAPFLRIVCEYTRDDAQQRGDTFCDNLEEITAS